MIVTFQIAVYRGTPKGNFLRNCLQFGFPLDTLQELSKRIDKYIFLKVLKIPKGLFQKSLWWGPGVKPLADKLKLQYKKAEELTAPRPFSYISQHVFQ
jgi:hypothetical protein